MGESTRSENTFDEHTFPLKAQLLSETRKKASHPDRAKAGSQKEI
jgi:hypothetical protein